MNPKYVFFYSEPGEDLSLNSKNYSFNDGLWLSLLLVKSTSVLYSFKISKMMERVP